jgi:hypothetical protein
LCENDGQCFQDDEKCPTSAICVCADCYYGSRCQLSTKGSALSLDTILGYQIRLNTGIGGQTKVVKFTIALTTIMLVLGTISGLLSILTFQRKKIRDFGCGLYLLASSIISLIIISMLIMKFWFLVTLQNGSITNRSFGHIQCVVIDFVLRVLLSTNDWLIACVAIERAVNISKGANFNKTRSTQLAKWIIPIVVLFSSCTHIHEPIHRHLIDDEDEGRTWCVTNYSSSLEKFDWAINIIHFSIPFLINGLSAVVIITKAARSRATAHKKQSYNKILYEQFQCHKHLLISSFILILLALPRLIISFIFGCMKSARNPWIYLIGYFISFISPMLNFVVFILPSAVYKKEFKELVKSFCHK